MVVGHGGGWSWGWLVVRVVGHGGVGHGGSWS